ncbi:MAG: phosphate/phosphite/phosphonate ABC transporter substrate-binding protein [Candidatus Omnitrophica bacterium]|nr:phosphate/phosphite/phosphonate ABC transporter substrate-binding protein [Candidatus Omnitrophota bacterium]
MFGRVSDNPRKHYQRMKPFIDYLAKRLNDYGIKGGDVFLANNDQQMIKALKEGKVDIVTETFFSSLIYMEKAGTIPILRRWKQGRPDYLSYIFVRRDSKINSLSDLKGKVIAFEDPGSTTGYFLPKIALLKAGVNLVKLNNCRERPPEDKTGYCFAYGEQNIALLVHKKIVEIGTLSDEEYREPDEVPTGILADFKIIHATESIPRNFISVRKELSPELIGAIKEVLFTMHQNTQGRELMRKLEKTVAFDEYESADFVRKMKEYSQWIKDDLETYK